MSVSVNLQEVFSADSQSNLTQKINFNFNQLLTLGLGEAGPIGLTGGPGPIGPVGPIGLTGDRGARVYSTLTIDSPILDPALAPNSENGDLYINTRELFVKGNTTSGIWEGVVDFQALITSQSLQDTYKVFQLGVGGGDSESKHAKFLRTNGVDTTNSGFSSSHPMYYTGSSTPNNTQLILSNFDELKTWKIQAGSLVENDNESDDIFEYNALAKIYAFLPSSVSGWRHQLEIGSVDDVAVTVGGVSQQYVLTPSEQNLKIRKYRVAAAALEGGLYNTAELDLSGLTASSNSLNSEIILAVNKKTPTVSQIIQMGLTTAPILADRLASANLGTDGLILSKANTQHIAFGFDNAIASRINLNTSSNISLLKVNHANLNLANGNLAITVDDLAKEISLGTAIKVKNDRLSQGLPFPATPVLSTDPNTLDDYEEGTWTPVMETVNTMVYGTDNNDGNNYQTTNSFGRYVKIGKFVFITFQIDVRFRLDTGVTFAQLAPLNLGFTSAGFTTYGSETYGMRLTGLPNIASDTAVIFDIELRAVVATNQTLRTQTLNVQYSDGSSSNQTELEPIVPASIFGRYYCQSTTNPTPRIELLGNRYAPTSDRVSSIASRVQPHDFLKEHTTAAGEFTRIHGSGWIIDNGSCVSGEDQSAEQQLTTTQANV
jgi:hypothetical protein